MESLETEIKAEFIKEYGEGYIDFMARNNSTGVDLVEFVYSGFRRGYIARMEKEN